MEDAHVLLDRARAFIQLVHSDNTNVESKDNNDPARKDDTTLEASSWADAAAAQLEAALAVAEATGDEHLAAEVLLSAATLHALKGETQEAADCLQQVAKVAGAYADPILEAKAVCCLAHLVAANVAAIDELNPEYLHARACRLLKGAGEEGGREIACGGCKGPVTDATEAEGGSVVVLPCRCVFHSAHYDAAAIAKLSVCPACTRHVCGLRFPGLDVCAACEGRKA
jgi:hypothetical protein